MPIIKSIFWLCVAFVVVGPQFDYRESVSSISTQAVDRGQQVLLEQTDARKCASIECFGTSMAVSAGVNAVGNFLEHGQAGDNALIHTGTIPSSPALIAPIPRARLDRSG